MAFKAERERELQARADELAILRHAERLKVICGRDRAVDILEKTLREVSSPHLLSDEYIGGKTRAHR